MGFQEYPKAVYQNGEVLVVDDEAQETEAIGNGYADWQTDQARMNGEAEAPAPAKRTRKTAAEAEAPAEKAE